jgi:hypothetical protein
MTDPINPERLAEIHNAQAEYPIRERGELLAEVARLTRENQRLTEKLNAAVAHMGALTRGDVR